jgi:hypothetical protein
MAAPRFRRAALGTTMIAGLGLLGTGAAGVLALDNDLRAAERRAAPPHVRQQRDAVYRCPGRPHRAPRRTPAREQV